MPSRSVLRPRPMVGVVVALAMATALLVAAAPVEASRRPAPRGLSATVQQTSLAVRWHRVRKAPGYRVRWSVRRSMAGAHRVATTRHRATITSLAPDKRYFVQVAVAARKGRGHRLGPWSRVLARRTLPPPCPTQGNLGDPTPVVPTGKASDLRVASFNIRTINLDSAAHPEQQWRNRADRVASFLVGAATSNNAATAPPDVVALQEANQSYREFAARCTNQMIDLRNRLNARGGHYEATSLNPSSSVGTRILFDTTRLRLETSGSVLLAPASTTHPHLAWAVFQMRDGGQRFFFGSVHLVPHEASDSNAVRDAEWDQLLAVLPGLRQGLPVVLGGDFNSPRSGVGLNTSALSHLPRMASAGVADTLVGDDPAYADRELAIGTTRPVASPVNAHCMSHNGFLVTERCAAPTVVGQHIDYLFGSDSLVVQKWEQVLDVDAGGNWLGTIPSDHNLIRATLTLPPA